MTTPRARRAGEVLLRSLSQDTSPAHAKHKTLLALGSGAIVASTGAQAAASTAPAAAAKTAGLAGGTAYAGAGVLKVALVKSVLVGALCGVATVGGARYLEVSSKPAAIAQAQHAAPAVAAKTPAQGDRAAEASEVLEVPPPPIDPSEPAPNQEARGSISVPGSIDRRDRSKGIERPTVAGAQRDEKPAERVELSEPAPSSAAVASAPTRELAPLSEEIRLVDGARAALVADDPRRALRELDAYARAFPSGKLAEEASVLRIEVLAKLGDRASAERLAGEFVQAHPTSGHLRKIRSILSSGVH